MTASVAASSSQYCRRSLPLTSTRLPAETKVDRPSPRRTALSSSAMPSAPDWEKKPSRPRAGHDRRQRGVQRHLRVGVDDAEASSGPRTRMPLPRASATRSPLPLAPLVARSRRSRCDITTRPRTPLRRAVGDDLLDLLGRYGDDGEVDRVGDVPDAAVRRHAGDLVGARVHGMDRAGEAGVERGAAARRGRRRAVAGSAPTTATDSGLQQPLRPTAPRRGAPGRR